jgi:hypothetical protein
MKAIRVTLIALVSLIYSTARADIEACITEGYGSNKAYKVHGQIVSGAKLISATGDYSKWTSYRYYFTVFWKPDQATILELPAGYSSVLPLIKTTVTDQEGRNWEIVANTYFCN